NAAAKLFECFHLALLPVATVVTIAVVKSRPAVAEPWPYRRQCRAEPECRVYVRRAAARAHAMPAAPRASSPESRWSAPGRTRPDPAPTAFAGPAPAGCRTPRASHGPGRRARRPR